MKRIAILLAAGRGSRMDGAVADKMLARVGGRPVIHYSVRCFSDCAAIDALVVVYRDDAQREALQEAVAAALSRQLPITWVKGGASRRQSVLNALIRVEASETMVLIHDCARPLIHVGLIDALIEAVGQDGAAAAAHPVVDTIKRLPQADATDAVLLEDLERQRLWATETPQAFRLELIRAAHEAVRTLDKVFTDDVAVANWMGHPVKLVHNRLPNPKLTTAADLNYIEWLLSRGSN